MAVHELSPESAADAHPLANPGYGKRSAPEQLPRTASDFAHLPAREASIAAYLDRLPEGADVSVKTLAKVLPYGQCALWTALRRLSEAGHLRRVREHLLGDGPQHWVTRTYFTRTARDDAWWASFRAGGGVPSRGVREAEPPRRREPAFEALAGLGRRDARMTLSAAACAALAPLAARWLERGVTPEGLGLALTAGLPSEVHSPRALARRRLTDGMPPEPPPVPPVPPAAPAPSRPASALRLLECSVCQAPGRPEALPGGVCAACRGEARPSRPRIDAQALSAQVNRVRATMRPSVRSRT